MPGPDRAFFMVRTLARGHFTRPLRGSRRAKLALGSTRAKRAAGRGDGLSTSNSAHVERLSPHLGSHYMRTDPRASFARLGPLQGRIRTARINSPARAATPPG